MQNIYKNDESTWNGLYLQVRLKVRYLHCVKSQGYSSNVSSSNNRRMLGLR